MLHTQDLSFVFVGHISNRTSDHEASQPASHLHRPVTAQPLFSEAAWCNWLWILRWEDSMGCLMRLFHVVVAQKNDAVHLDYVGS